MEEFLCTNGYTKRCFFFRNQEISKSIPIFRSIAKALPAELPFSFGANLRGDVETREILRRPSQFHAKFLRNTTTSFRKLDDLTILVSVDQYYFLRLGSEFLESVQKKAPGAHVHIHFCDWDIPVGNVLDDLAKRWGEIRISASSSHSGRMQRRTYYACARLLVLPDILTLTRSPVLMVDFDSTFRRDPRTLLPQLRDVDVGVSESKGTSFWNIINASFLWVAPSSLGIQFAENVRRYLFSVLSSPESTWTADQTALWVIFRHMKDNVPVIRFANLRSHTGGGSHARDLKLETIEHKSVSRQFNNRTRSNKP
jgi:hypothetical protein